MVLAGAVCIPISAALTLWLPRLIGEALDKIGEIASGDGSDPTTVGGTLATTCLLFAGVATLDALFRFFGRRLIINASRFVEEDLKSSLMNHISRLRASWFDRAQTGDLISRFTQDVELLRFVVGPFILHGGMAILIVPASIWLMATLSPTLTLAAGSIFGLLVVSLALLLPHLLSHSRAVQESIALISQRSNESFSGIRVLMNFARAREETETIRQMSEDYLGHNMKLTRLRSLLNLSIHCSRDLVTLAILVIGGLEALEGRITIGQLFEFLLYLGIIVWPLTVTGWLIALLPRAFAAAERIEEVFQQEPEPTAGREVDLVGAIEARNLTFSYGDEERAALTNLSFTLPAGQKLGIVGPVGSGKSTLISLLLRLYDPPRGSIFIDGHDITNLAPSSLRKLFAVAPQDPFLFSDTINSNISFSSDEMDGKDIDKAVRASALDQDIEDFPQGLGSIVGERGLTLSGGQKQRVSLARALAAKRPALILDDTISAVDQETELRILKHLEHVRGERTLVVTAHRLSAVADADLIIVLDHGKAAEMGTHTELIALDGYYAQAWRLQREEAALDGPGENL